MWSRLYRLALRVLPRDVRKRHGAPMAAVFDELLREARQRGGARAMARASATELMALLPFAAGAWRGRPAPRRLDESALAATTAVERGSPMIAALMQDARYAARLLRRSPGFTLVCVTTMALAVGFNTAIFGVVHGVMLQALPFADPDTVVVLGHQSRAGTTEGGALDSTTPGNLYDWMRGATAFTSLAGFTTTERIFTMPDGAERIQGGLCVGDVFGVLGREAAQGRALRASDDDPGAPPVVVLSAQLARRLFPAGGAVARSLTINGTPHTVVGVMPADFAFFDYTDEYWVPARFDAAFRANRDQYFLAGVARLKPGVSREQAEVQLNTVMDAIRRDWPQFTQNAVAAVRPLKAVLLDGVEQRLIVLMGAAVFVLLIACANLGNLLLARATIRQREMAVRHALGAGHGRLVRQMLAESVVLAALGGLAGLAVGATLLRVLMANLPEDLPRLGGVSLDLPVLLFAAGIALAAGLLFGVVPALQVARTSPLQALRDGTRVSGRGGYIRAGLVVSELALALMLLAGAGLLARSFAALLQVPPGFAADRLLTFTAALPTRTYISGAERTGFFERAATDLARLPGVRAVTFTTTLPVAGRGSGAWFNMLDRPVPADQTPPALPNRFVRANYFDTIGIPIVSGRAFTEHDWRDGPRVVIISASVARRFYPDRNPIGQRIYMGAPDNRVVPDAEIVGVAADVKQRGLDEERPEAVYVPHAAQPTMPSFTFALRTAGDPAALGSAVRDVIRQLDPGVPVLRLQTMDDILGRATAPARSTALLVGLFAGVALTLALIGVFGVLSYNVSQQTAEFGIRMALGASAGTVQRHVLRRGMQPVFAGVGLGLAGALGLAQFMRTLLFGVTPADPLTLSAVVALIVATAALAAYLPARRATRVDPVQALRQQ